MFELKNGKFFLMWSLQYFNKKFWLVNMKCENGAGKNKEDKKLSEFSNVRKHRMFRWIEL